MTSINTVARRLAVASTATAGVLALCAAPATAGADDAALARQGTATYQNSDVITGDPDNWGELSDIDGITCIDNPAGGMGIHFVNGARVGDPTENAAEPEAVIYEPTKNGGLRLVAVEYVVLKQSWEDAGNTDVPSLFGQDFELIPAGNRFGLPDFYELHAWVWKNNPAGLNDDWNPNVTCAYAS